MSELKARRAYFSEDEYDKGAHKICAKVSDCGYDRRNDWWSYAFEDEVYIKSEADRYIAELQSANQLEIDEWYNKLMYQKYKRCLAMARMCEERSERYFSWSKKMDFILKWKLRWLELAEKFKDNEAK